MPMTVLVESHWREINTGLAARRLHGRLRHRGGQGSWCSSSQWSFCARIFWMLRRIAIPTFAESWTVTRADHSTVACNTAQPNLVMSIRLPSDRQLSMAAS